MVLNDQVLLERMISAMKNWYLSPTKFGYNSYENDGTFHNFSKL